MWVCDNCHKDIEDGIFYGLKSKFYCSKCAAENDIHLLAEKE